MFLRAFYKQYLKLTVKSAVDRVLHPLETVACGIFYFITQCFLQTLEAPVDFITLVISIK